MSKAQKVVNYSEDQTVALVTAYKLAETDDERSNVVIEFANGYHKTEASIRAKLSREGVYVKPKRTTKSGGAIVRKAALVDSIAKRIGKANVNFESLEKATKQALEAILEALPSNEEVEE
jgi:glutamate dehydrogenase/leucine dehydrogenase